MNTTERNVIETFRRILARKLHVDQIVLFCSRARGDAVPDSDMDLLVGNDPGEGGLEPKIPHFSFNHQLSSILSVG